MYICRERVRERVIYYDVLLLFIIININKLMHVQWLKYISPECRLFLFYYGDIGIVCECLLVCVCMGLVKIVIVTSV